MLVLRCLLALIFAQVPVIAGKSKETYPYLKLGFMATLSGTRSEEGFEALRGFQRAIEEKNSLGGISGRQLKVIAYDTKSSPAEALLLFKKIKQDGITVLTGEFSNNEGLVISKEAEKNTIPLVVYNINHPEISSHRKFVLPIGFNLNSEVKTLARYAKGRLQAHNAIQVVDVSDSYSVALGKELKRHFELGGGTVTDTIEVRNSETEFSEVLKILANLKNKPDVLFVNTPAITATALFSALSTNSIAIPFIGNSTWKGKSLASIQEKTNLSDTTVFISKTSKNSYDAGSLILRALGKSVSTDPRILMRVLKNENTHGRNASLQVQMIKRGKLSAGIAE